MSIEAGADYTTNAQPNKLSKKDVFEALLAAALLDGIAGEDQCEESAELAELIRFVIRTDRENLGGATKFEVARRLNELQFLFGGN